MLESMVSLERRAHASEAVVSMERGVIRTLEMRAVPVACAWVRRANRAEAAGGRGVCLSRSQGSGDAVAA